MTDSDNNADAVQDREATVLMILHPLEGLDDPHAGQARADLLGALAHFGFSCGPVVGDVCAVTGRAVLVQALQDHALIMHNDQQVEGANEQLLALLRPALLHIAVDEAVEPFPDEALDPTLHINQADIEIEIHYGDDNT